MFMKEGGKTVELSGRRTKTIPHFISSSKPSKRWHKERTNYFAPTLGGLSDHSRARELLYAKLQATRILLHAQPIAIVRADDSTVIATPNVSMSLSARRGAVRKCETM